MAGPKVRDSPCPTRKGVGAANHKRMGKLSLPEKIFKSYDVRGTSLEQEECNKILGRLVVPAELALRVGAQVMLLKNLKQGRLVNGSLGLVTAFMSVDQANNADVEVVGVGRLGSTPAPEAQVVIGGQGANPEQDNGAPQWPVVRFTNGDVICCTPSNFDVTNARGLIEASREQVPLIAAWAMSIHKSQGQTLSRVKIDLERTFAPGQAYTAISRARSLETLQILNFDASRVFAHPRVLEWYSELQGNGIEDNDAAG